MSDSALVLVARVNSPAAVAAGSLAHLASADIIEPLPTDSALGKLAHRPGARVLDAVEKLGPNDADFRTLRTNGWPLTPAFLESLHSTASCTFANVHEHLYSSVPRDALPKPFSLPRGRGRVRLLQPEHRILLGRPSRLDAAPRTTRVRRPRGRCASGAA